jgi:uncharacterized protein (DUF2132 family)
MAAHISKDPLHGVTLEMQINALVAHYGWEKLGQLIKINCFKSDPSVKSSLKFLRRTPWARTEVEVKNQPVIESKRIKSERQKLTRLLSLFIKSPLDKTPHN